MISNCKTNDRNTIQACCLLLLQFYSLCFFYSCAFADGARIAEIIKSSQPEALVGQLHTYIGTQEDACYVSNLWRENESMETEANTILKLEISRALLSIEENYSCIPNKDDLHSYIVELATHGDVISKSNAILILGMLGSTQDIGILYQIALKEELLTFYQAVAALGMHETKEAREALNELANHIRNENLKTYIIEHRYMKRKVGEEMGLDSN